MASELQRNIPADQRKTARIPAEPGTMHCALIRHDSVFSFFSISVFSIRFRSVDLDRLADLGCTVHNIVLLVQL